MDLVPPTCFTVHACVYTTQTHATGAPSSCWTGRGRGAAVCHWLPAALGSARGLLSQLSLIYMGTSKSNPTIRIHVLKPKPVSRGGATGRTSAHVQTPLH